MNVSVPDTYTAVCLYENILDVATRQSETRHCVLTAVKSLHEQLGVRTRFSVANAVS